MGAPGDDQETGEQRKVECTDVSGQVPDRVVARSHEELGKRSRYSCDSHPRHRHPDPGEARRSWATGAGEDGARQVWHVEDWT